MSATALRMQAAEWDGSVTMPQVSKLVYFIEKYTDWIYNCRVDEKATYLADRRMQNTPPYPYRHNGDELARAWNARDSHGIPQSIKRLLSACGLLLAVCCLPDGVYARDCTGLPTSFTGNEFPSGDFFTNFNNNCYLIPFSTGSGQGGQKGDRNSVY